MKKTKIGIYFIINHRRFRVILVFINTNTFERSFPKLRRIISLHFLEMSLKLLKLSGHKSGIYIIILVTPDDGYGTLNNHTSD